MTKNESSEASQGDWTKLANYNSGFEADIVRSRLEEADILVQLRGQQVGIFGLGFQGPVLGGVDLYVPTEDLEQARDLLE